MNYRKLGINVLQTLDKINFVVSYVRRKKGVKKIQAL